MNTALVLLLIAFLPHESSAGSARLDSQIIYDYGMCPGHTGFVCQDGNPSAYYEMDCDSYVVGCQFDRVTKFILSSTETPPVQWSGTLPSVLGQLTALTELRIYNAGISGTIPLEIWNMSSLVQLRLIRTSLSGTLPIDSPLYASNKRLYLTRNQLSGEIPAALTWRSPEILFLDGNNFRGRVPPFTITPLLCDLSNNPELGCPFDGPLGCNVNCTVDCTTNNITVSNCTDVICLANGVETCYDPCYNCPRCVFNNTLEIYSCEPLPTPTPTPSPSMSSRSTLPQSSESVSSSAQLPTSSYQVFASQPESTRMQPSYNFQPTNTAGRLALSCLILIL